LPGYRIVKHIALVRGPTGNEVSIVERPRRKGGRQA